MTETDPRLTGEVARQKKLTRQWRARANWAFVVSIIAGLVVGAAPWFILYERPMDSLDVKCSVGFGGAATVRSPPPPNRAELPRWPCRACLLC